MLSTKSSSPNPRFHLLLHAQWLRSPAMPAGEVGCPLFNIYHFSHPPHHPLCAKMAPPEIFSRALFVYKSSGWQVVDVQRKNWHPESTVPRSWGGILFNIYSRAESVCQCHTHTHWMTWRRATWNRLINDTWHGETRLLKCMTVQIRHFCSVTAEIFIPSSRLNFQIAPQSRRPARRARNVGALFKFVARSTSAPVSSFIREEK